MPLYPINLTGRSARLARALGFFERKLLSFHDDTPIKHRLSDPTLPLRSHLSNSLTESAATPSFTYSAAKYGRRKPDRILDSGPIDSFSHHPCAWSSKDIIAAVIRGRVFTHSMETNQVSTILDYGLATCVEWTSSSQVAVGHDWGGIIIADVAASRTQRYFLPEPQEPNIVTVGHPSGVNALSWNKERSLLAIGRSSGAVAYYDPRDNKLVKSEPTDPQSIYGIQWSPDGMFLASGRSGGVVRCMDWRANKSFDLKSPQRKTAHKGVVKV